MGTVMNQSSPIYVGIDVSGDFLDLAIHESTEAWRVSNDPASIDQLVQRVLQSTGALIGGH